MAGVEVKLHALSALMTVLVSYWSASLSDVYRREQLRRRLATSEDGWNVVVMITIAASF
jgi:hypothetical protein